MIDMDQFSAGHAYYQTRPGFLAPEDISPSFVAGWIKAKTDEDMEHE